MKIKVKKERREFSIKKLQKYLNEIGENIKNENFALDLPFTVAEGNQVVRIYKDGRKEVIAQIKPVESKLKGKKFIIPK